MPGTLVVIHGAIFLQGLFPLYAVLFLLCAVANSLYAVLISSYSPDLVLTQVETRSTTQGGLGMKHRIIVYSHFEALCVFFVFGLLQTWRQY